MEAPQRGIAGASGAARNNVKIELFDSFDLPAFSLARPFVCLFGFRDSLEAAVCCSGDRHKRSGQRTEMGFRKIMLNTPNRRKCE